MNTHSNEGVTASTVRRSTRGLARMGAAAAAATVMGSTAREEGDREMELESDGSAGSN